MSRKGHCLDNAAMESFLGRMKTECFHGKSFTGIDELERLSMIMSGTIMKNESN